MKILLIDVNCKYSSTGKIVYDLYKKINDTGNVAAICYGRGEKIHESNIFKFGIDIETKIHALLTRLTGFTGCFSLFSTKRLIKFIKKFKPDVVHIHELHAYFVNIKPLLKYLKKQNIKIVSTLHCEFNYTGKCGHSKECIQWKSECKSCPHKKDYPKSMFFDQTKYMFRQKKKSFLGFNDFTVVTPSNWLANRCEESFLKEYPIMVINNGIDTTIFKYCNQDLFKQELKITDEKIVLSVAPDIMSKNKGGHHIIKIANMMKDKNIKFILVGVENMNEDFPENVIPVKKTKNQQELVKYYSLADCFLICSENENFPTTCLEAQCCGLPICGFNVGGTKETSLFYSNQLLVPYMDYKALVNSINKALSMSIDKNEISKISINKYSKDVMLESYLNLYKQKLNR